MRFLRRMRNINVGSSSDFGRGNSLNTRSVILTKPSLALRALLGSAVIVAFNCSTIFAQTSAPAVDPVVLVQNAERQRIEAMAKAAPSVVAVLEESGNGGGSGVLLTADGYGLTNFHVVAPMLESREGLGGLSNGKIYPLKVLGVDPTGDLAMFKLDPTPVSDATAGASDESGSTEGSESGPAKRPTTSSAPSSQPEGSGPFRPAEIGDSDEIHVGDPVFAMGNPFLLAEDYTPTTTFGIVSGVHRYQFGADGRNLVYTDCLQIDASINPGNSGGPLFDLMGRLIGINGRASFEQRGRVNVGLAYAISINQAKRFIPALRAGLRVEHGLLGATTMDLGYRRVVFEKMLDPSPAAAAGIQIGDRLREFGGRPIHSANQFLNILGTYPVGWPVRVVYEHEGKSVERTVRLERLPVQVPFEPDASLNKTETKRILAACRKAMGDWPAKGTLKWKVHRQQPPAEVFQVEASESMEGGGQLQIKQMNGQPVREFQYNGRTAQVREAGKDWSPADALETARVNLWMAGRRALIGSSSENELKLWQVVGADAYGGKVVDLLEYKSDAGALRVAIDPVSHLPMRMFFQSSEPPSPKNPTLEIEFEEYQLQDGVRLPRQIWTYVGGLLTSMDSVVSYVLERS